MANISSSVDDDWSKEDERQCALCQKYGDAKPNVSAHSGRSVVRSTVHRMYECAVLPFSKEAVPYILYAS